MNPFPFSEQVNELVFKKAEEKSKIRKEGNLIGFAFTLNAIIMLFTVSGVLGLLYPVGLGKIFYGVIKDATLSNMVQIIVSFIAFTVPFWLLSRFFETPLNTLLPTKSNCSKKTMVVLGLIGLGVCGFSNIATNLAGDIFENFGFYYSSNNNEPNPTNFFGIALSVLATAVAPALFEEFALRGVVLSLLRKHGDNFAIIISALLFGLMHGNPPQIPFAFMLGVYFAYVTIKTGNIWTAVVMHFLNNLFSVIYTYIVPTLTLEQQIVCSITYNGVLLLVGFIGLMWLKKTLSQLPCEEKADSVLSFKAKVAVILTSPVMWAFYVLMGYKIYLIMK